MENEKDLKLYAAILAAYGVLVGLAYWFGDLSAYVK